MLDRAARAALRGFGLVEPNPMVGAVIVRDGRVLAIGHHRAFGQAHAEREALDRCRVLGHDPRGATMYVTLEPCAHHGHNPPCTDAIIEAGVARVVYARSDPNPEAAGGAEALTAAGIEAELCQRSTLAHAVAEPFITRLRQGRPWVIAKWAQTIDGRIATRTGHSKWISTDASRRRVHALRGRVDCILTGIGTVLADDPLLTVRAARARRTPRRVVLDTDLDIPLESALVRSAAEGPVAIACLKELAVADITLDKRMALERAGVEVIGVPPSRLASQGRPDALALLRMLHESLGVSTVLVEAGAGLLGSMLERDLIDDALVYIAPTVLGDERAMPAAAGRVAESLSVGRRFGLMRMRRVGDDVELLYRRRREEGVS